VTTHGPADPERVLAHMASVSWIAGPPASQGAEVLARMRAIQRGVIALRGGCRSKVSVFVVAGDPLGEAVVTGSV